MLESAFSIVTVIFLMLLVGFLCQHFGWLGENAQIVIARLTLRVGMPALFFSNILSNFTRDMLGAGLLYMVAPLVVIGMAYGLSRLLSEKVLRLDTRRRGVFCAMFSLGNVVFLGMPVCRAIFGEAAVSNVLYYYFINTLFWWLVVAPTVARDGGKDMSSPFKRLASPPLISCLLSLFLVLIGFKPPKILLDTAQTLGAMVTPLSMVFIGCTLAGMLKGGLRWQKGYGWLLVGRFILGPALCLPLCLLLGLPKAVLGVFILQAGLPSQTQSCLWAKEHGADADYAAGGIALSTLCSLAAIPLHTWIIGLL